MKPQLLKIAVIVTALFVNSVALADRVSDKDRLKISAIEALMVAPQERSLPVLKKVMASDNSTVVKERALFVLGQIDHPDALAIILGTARDNSSPLQGAAIRTIGISGDATAMAQLSTIFSSGSRAAQKKVLEAYLIAGDADAILNAALETSDDEIFDVAVSRLGAMGALEQLKQLRGKTGTTRSLIQAYAISGDVESLLLIARDSSNPEQQIQAIQSLGIARSESDKGEMFMRIYRENDRMDVRRAVMHGMMLSGDDTGLLTLFEESDNEEEKTMLLRQLVMMDSDAAIEAIDKALAE
ncbi:MAG: HEAT repeat domain-containing protein [Pseudomonadota bacterium]